MRALLLASVLVLPGCMGVATQGFQTTDRALSRADQEILEQCADLDDPVNAARIDALALITGATQGIAIIRNRREAYCAYKRYQVGNP